jgi:hypothetical protein
MRDSFLNGARSVAHQGRRYPCGVRSTHCIGGPYGGNRLNEYGHRQSSLDIEVRQKLAAYLRSELAFPKFKKWFIARTWDVESQGNGNDVELAHSIHIRLIEFSKGTGQKTNSRACFVRSLRPTGHTGNRLTSNPRNLSLFLGGRKSNYSETST